MEIKRISRRDFLKIGCAGTAAVGLAVCGVSAIVSDPETIELKTITYGENIMNDRILVAYATWAGSTLEVAQSIGKTMAANGTAVDFKPIVELQEGTALRSNGYRAVVIGRAVQYGNWLPEAVDFVKTNSEYLAGLPVALFCVHIRNTADDAESQRNRHAYLDEARRYVNPCGGILRW